MANVLSLALRVTADASGLKLDPVQRALVGLGDQAEKLTKQFESFTGGSEAAAKAQANFDKQAQDLINTLRDGGSATEFAAGFERLTEAVTKEAAAFERAARITEANLSPLQKFERAQAELTEQVEAGRISQDTYERALAKAKAQLDGTATSASKTDKNIESLTKNVRVLSAIEIGRAIIDGLQAIGNVISGVVNRVSQFVSSVASSFDSFNDLSARTGIGVEALQGYSLAAKLAGVDTEAFGAAVQKLAVNIGKATPGDALDKSLRNINLSVTQLRGLAPEQQFSTIAESIAGLPTAADRAAAAVAVFGKQGAALAPLFREGAASIDELRVEAKQLGAIVSDQQISNIGEMNDAFDKVRFTITGIIGQVIGNLAPAVTAVTDAIIEYIKVWEGTSTQGTGGTGIANAITEVLLNGAETLAGVFDSFVGNFSGFTVTLEETGAVFKFIGNLLVSISEGLRVVFNTFERVGNLLIIGLGKILEGLGSWVSSDMEQLGKDLQATGRAQFEQNGKELEQAAKNAADALERAFTGGDSSLEAAGEGAATKVIKGARQKFEQSQAPEFKINTNIEQTRDRFDSFFNGIVDQSSAIVAPMREFEAAIAAAQEDGQMTADEIARIEQLQAKVNSAIDQELAARQEAAEAAAKQAEEVDKIVTASLEQIRIDEQFGGDSSRAKAADNLLKIQQEIVRVEEQLQAARSAGDTEAVSALTSRLATLDQVEARETDIASGAKKAREEAAKQVEKLNEDIAKRQESLLDKQFEIELARVEELANVRTGSVEINDLRSGGISAFFDTLQEDPAIAEAKKQTKELEKMRKELAKLQAEKVDILAGTG
jgi:hypothetical protein